MPRPRSESALVCLLPIRAVHLALGEGVATSRGYAVGHRIVRLDELATSNGECVVIETPRELFALPIPYRAGRRVLERTGATTRETPLSLETLVTKAAAVQAIYALPAQASGRTLFKVKGVTRLSDRVSYVDIDRRIVLQVTFGERLLVGGPDAAALEDTAARLRAKLEPKSAGTTPPPRPISKGPHEISALSAGLRGSSGRSRPICARPVYPWRSASVELSRRLSPSFTPRSPLGRS